MRSPWHKLAWWLGGGILLVAAVVTLLGLWTDWLWFDSLGFQAVLVRMWVTRIELFLAGLAWGVAVLVGGWRWSRREPPPSWAAEQAGQISGGPVLWQALPYLVAIAAVAVAVATTTLWSSFLAMWYAVDGGKLDPIYHRDVSFYMLRLPFWTAAQRLMVVTLLLSWVGLYFRYVEIPLERTEDDPLHLGDAPMLTAGAVRHLSLLGAAVFAMWGWGFYLARFGLMTSSRSKVVWGVSYADAAARIPALAILCGLAVVAAGVLLLNARAGRTARLGWTVGGFALMVVVGTGVPAIYQRLVVLPNEIECESPYLRQCIGFTRLGLGLDRAKPQQYEVVDSLSATALREHEETLHTIPLWSTSEITEQLVGTETLRTYYNFWVTDYDRYRIGGKREQVAVVLREMQTDRLDPAAQTWVNRHTVYTHGYGLAMASAHDTGEAGKPVKLIGDIPARTPPDLPLTRPQVYYGEVPSDYIVTGLSKGSATTEFDYPSGEKNVTTAYQGDGGLPLGGRLQRLAFAMRFRSINLLVSDLPGPAARLHFRREVADRVAVLAPFLDLDSDPYPVLADGKLCWIQDAYTVSDKYPYAWPYPLYPAVAVAQEQPERTARRQAAYVRNSVKVVVDAYTGKVSFHIYDRDCPVLRTWQRIFPTLFTDDPLPPPVAEHVRYPNDLFTLQARAYARFHMTEPQVFYNSEDLWDFAREMTTTRIPQPDGTYQFAQARERMLPYYVLLRLPGEQEARFRLIVPFTPASTAEALTGRDNLIGWLAADCEPGPRYGELTVFDFPKSKLVYGPLQVEALIDQDPDISREISLWSEQGSKVLRGHLLVIPLGESLLYVEPLFLTAERRGALPELKRVVVLYNGLVRMAETLDEALTAALTGERSRGGAVELWQLRAQARTAQAALSRADSARRGGDLPGYGAALEELRRAVSSMAPEAGR